MRKLKRFGDPQLLNDMMQGVSKYRPAVKFWLIIAALIILILMIRPIRFNLAAITVADKAVVVQQYSLSSGIFVINRKIAQADFSVSGDIMNHPDNQVSVAASGGSVVVHVIKSASIWKAVVIE